MYNYRCTHRHCRKRTTLKHHKEWYIKTPHCKVCGGNIKHDPHVKIASKKNVCFCDGYHFPHRKGTEPWCSKAKIGPCEEDQEDRYNSPAIARSYWS